MTFTARSIALGVGFLVLLSAQGAVASKQVITCESSISVVLFGLQSAYGEIFNSGLTNVTNDGSSASVASQARVNEDRLSDALFAGSDYNGNAVSIQLPKAIIGKSVMSPFSALAKLTFNKSKQEKTLEIRCVSQVSQ
jgi:hypothetical protein